MGFLATGGLTEQMIVNLVNGRFEDNYQDCTRQFKKFREWYNLYRCIYTGERPPFKNVVMLPLLFSACWSDIANKAAISLADKHIVEMSTIDPDSGPSAKRAEALINQQFIDARLFEKMIDFLMCSDIYGTGILQYGYRKQVMPYIYRQKTLGIEYPIKMDVTTFEGPDIEVIDPLDFVPQRGKKFIDDMTYCFRRYWKDLDDLEEQAYSAMKRGEEPEFDPESIALLKSQSEQAQASPGDMIERQLVWRSWTEYQNNRQERFGKPVELIDMVGLVPAEYAPDGVRFRIMTLGNRRVSMRNIPSPHMNCRKHFRSYCPMPDPHFFWGAGKVEMGATMAASGNKLVSNRLDVLDLALQPAMFVSDSTELDTQNLVLWPGRVIKVHGETGDTQIRPVQFDLQAYPMVVNELEAISRYIDMGTGVQRDTIQGMLSGDRQTAREFIGRMESAKTRLGLESMIFEKSVIEPLAEDFRLMDRMWLPFPREVNLIGSAALMDPDSGEPLPPEMQLAELYDINMDHKIRAVGASNMLSKSMQRQDMMTALQAMQSNPIALQITNWIAFFSRFWRAFDFNPREMMQVNPMGAQAAWQGMNDQQRMGPQGDILEQLGGGMMGPQAGAQIPLMSGMGAGLQQNQGA